MSDHTERSEKLSLKEKVSRFLSMYQNVIIAVGVVILLVIVSLSIYSLVMSKRIENSTEMADELQQKFEEWEKAEEGKKADFEEQIEEKAENIISSYSGLYAGARARLFLGRMYAENENWEKAVEEYLAIAESFPENYLAPVALMSAAAGREELEEYETAIKHYRRVVDDYSDSSPSTAHALFSIGRLNEAMGNESDALEAYNSLVDDFSYSNWTKPARSRIIYLESN